MDKLSVNCVLIGLLCVACFCFKDILIRGSIQIYLFSEPVSSSHSRNCSSCWIESIDWQQLEWHRLRHFIWFDTALYNSLSQAVLAPKTCEDFDVLIVKYSCVSDSSVFFFMSDGRRGSCVWMCVDEGINIPVCLVLLQQEARCSICHVNGERPAGSDCLQQYHLIQ